MRTLLDRSYLVTNFSVSSLDKIFIVQFFVSKFANNWIFSLSVDSFRILITKYCPLIDEILFLTALAENRSKLNSCLPSYQKQWIYCNFLRSKVEVITPPNFRPLLLDAIYKIVLKACFSVAHSSFNSRFPCGLYGMEFTWVVICCGLVVRWNCCGLKFWKYFSAQKSSRVYLLPTESLLRRRGEIYCVNSTNDQSLYLFN